MPEIELPGAMEQEPPTGSVVAIDWGEPRQEIWVSNRANVGSWYCPDIPMRGTDHPGWYEVRHRAEGRTLTLLTPGDRDTYAAGYDAGVATVQAAIDQIAGEYRLYVTGNYPAETAGAPDIPAACPESKMDDGAHSDELDGGCSWCGASAAELEGRDA